MMDNSAYIQEVLLLPPEDYARFRDLCSTLEALRAKQQKEEDSEPLTVREYERRYRNWRAEPPYSVRQKADYIGISKGIWAVDPYYREVFASLHPEWTPIGKQGRQAGFAPVKKERILRGEVMTALLDMAYDELRAKLSAPTLSVVPTKKAS